MCVYATRTKNLIPRVLNWHKKSMLKWPQLKSYMPINDEADLPLQTLTPTEDESAIDWWQASSVTSTDPEIHALRNEEEVRVLHVMVSSFQEEVHELYDEIMDATCYSEPDHPLHDFVLSVRRRGLCRRCLGPSIMTPYTQLPLRRRKKERQVTTTEAYVSEAGTQPVPKTQPVPEAQPFQRHNLFKM